jgi:p21-activated kinase 1
MDTPPSGTKSPRTNRYSDEGDAAKKRLSGGGKKKGTFSSFMSNLVSSPRRPTISTPTNPMHVTHVSIDNETGEFTVRGPHTHCAAALLSSRTQRVLCSPSLYPSLYLR